MPAGRPAYSVVVPVYDGRTTLAELAVRVDRVFRERLRVKHECVFVDDASQDDSWPILAAWAGQAPRRIAVRLARRVGQHQAVLAGVRRSRGGWVIVLDDDLQTPPEEIPKLLAEAREPRRLVMGKYPNVRQSAWRRWGSRLVHASLRRRHPAVPPFTSFKCIHRDLAVRLAGCEGRPVYLAECILEFIAPEDIRLVEVEHHPPRGKSRYTRRALFRAAWRLLRGPAKSPHRPVLVAEVIGADE